jgi:Flp pilus assembly protein TadD
MTRLATLAVLITLACASTPCRAVDTVSSTDAPDLTAVRAMIKAKDFKTAITELTKLTNTVQHADVYNLLGFSLRKSGDAKQALTFYKKALDFDPAHKGAHEYLGELYVETGEMDKAKLMLASLEKICPAGCEERTDLAAAITAASAKNATN